MNKFENEDKSILDLAQGLASSGQAFAYATVIRTAVLPLLNLVQRP